MAMSGPIEVLVFEIERSPKNSCQISGLRGKGRVLCLHMK